MLGVLRIDYLWKDIIFKTVPKKFEYDVNNLELVQNVCALAHVALTSGGFLLIPSFDVQEANNLSGGSPSKYKHFFDQKCGISSW